MGGALWGSPIRAELERAQFLHPDLSESHGFLRRALTPLHTGSSLGRSGWRGPAGGGSAHPPGVKGKQRREPAEGRRWPPGQTLHPGPLPDPSRLETEHTASFVPRFDDLQTGLSHSPHQLHLVYVLELKSLRWICYCSNTVPPSTPTEVYFILGQTFHIRIYCIIVATVVANFCSKICSWDHLCANSALTF